MDIIELPRGRAPTAVAGPATIQTQSGRYLDYLNPQPEQFTLFDLVSGMAREGRFSGQTHHGMPAYSVAQHCILTSLIVPKEVALYALFHDAAEAFLRDVATPLKNLLRGYAEQRAAAREAFAAQLAPYPPGVRQAALAAFLAAEPTMEALLPGYRALEHRLEQAIFRKLGLPANMPEQTHAVIKQADTVLLATERSQLMPATPVTWAGMGEITPLELVIVPMSAEEAYTAFIERYRSILDDRPYLRELALWEAQRDACEAEQHPSWPTPSAA